MFKNRLKYIFYSIALWLTLLFVPTKTVRAQFGIEILTAPFVFLAKAATAMILALPISGKLLAFGQIFVSWASNPNLLGGVTKNDFVKSAWGVVRDFTNLFFILIIVAIGIATALRIKQYEVRKTLPRLILVAVLINFSPVICGVVIDISNIFMNFFLTAGSAGFGDVVNLSTASSDIYAGAMKSAMGNLSEIWNGTLIFKMLILIIFNLFGAFMLMLLGGLFLLRHVALWVLVILSPLAFLGAVFEKGGKDAKKLSMFAQWRQEFIKWTFTGVTGAFFIYLAQLMVHSGLKNIAQPSSEVVSWGGKIISNTMVMAIPIVFLGIGYMVTTKTSGMGAKGLIGFAQKWGGKVNPMTKGGRDNLMRLRSQIKDIPGKIPGSGAVARKAQDFLNQQNENPTKWKDASGGQKISRVLMPNAVRKRMASGIVRSSDIAHSSAVQKVDKFKAEADKLGTKEARKAAFERKYEGSGLNGSQVIKKKLGILASAIDKGEMKEYAGKEPEIKSLLSKAQQVHPDLVKKIFKANPHLAVEMEQEMRIKAEAASDNGDHNKAGRIMNKMSRYDLTISAEDEARGIENVSDKITSGMKATDMANMNPNAISINTNDSKEKKAVKEQILDSLVKTSDGNKISTLIREQGKNTLDPIQNAINKLSYEQLNNSNPGLLKYLGSTTAGGLGLSGPEPPKPESEKPKSPILVPLGADMGSPETPKTPTPDIVKEKTTAERQKELRDRINKDKGSSGGRENNKNKETRYTDSV